MRTLGKGSFGKVKEALHVMSGEKIAIKILEKSRIKKDDDLVRIRREINILSKVHHPNIIQLYEVNKSSFFPKKFLTDFELVKDNDHFLPDFRFSSTFYFFCKKNSIFSP